MEPSHSCSSDSADPVRAVEFVPSSSNPLCVLIRIELAEHVAACCVNTDGAWVEFHKEEHTVRAEFVFRESRPGHLMEATVTLPAPGVYFYRLVAKVMGRPLIKEGNFALKSGC
jgi:hypothetical protein